MREDASTAAELAWRAVVLAGLSAMAAGAHEVAWSRLLGRAVGNTSVGIGLTLAVFMLGSGLGAIVVPRTPLWRRPRTGYVAAELTIALGGLLLLAYCLEAPLPSSVGLGLTADIVVAGLLSCVPAVAMGATYPLLVELTANVQARTVRALYAAGLVGVVAGTLGGAVLVAPVLGLDVLATLAASANVVLAGLALHWLPPRRAPRQRPEPGWWAREDTAALVRFAAAGILGLAAQSVWNRTVAPYAGVSTFTFAAIVAAYVLAQAAGFRLFERAGGTRPGIGDVALGASPLVALLCLGVLSLATELPPRDSAPLAWFVGVAAVVAAVVGPTGLLLGVSQAAALHRVERRDDGWGSRAAMVAGAGTIASAGGALFASLGGIATVGPRWTLVLASVPAALALVTAGGRASRAGVALVAAAAVALVAPGPRWFLGASFDREPTYFAEHGVQDTTAVVAVDLPVEPRIRRLVASGVSYSGDSLYAQRYMRMLGHLPALAARGQERALLICVGTGTTLDALRAYDFERIDAVDISPSVRRTLDFFRHVNRGAHEDPRVELVIDDGARYLRRASETYDVITLEPPPPRAPGASSLYSIEFYEAARARLRPGGAIAQWLPLHGMSGAELAVLARTFARVFENASLHVTERNEAVLLAVNADEPALTTLDEARWALVRRTAGLDAIGAGEWNPVRDTHLLDAAALSRALGDGPVVRDMWPMPEYAPLAGAQEAAMSADALVETLAHASTAERGTLARILAGAIPGFLRLERGRGTDPDRVAVTRAMRAWLARDPESPYVQHAFGFGPLLEERLDRLSRSGELDDAETERVRRIIERQRATVGSP